MKRHLSLGRVLGLILVGLFANGSAQAGSVMKAGLWEQTVVKDEITGKKKGEIDHDCMSAKKADAYDSRESLLQSAGAKLAKGCEVKNYAYSSKQVGYQVVCKGVVAQDNKVFIESPTKRRVVLVLDFGKGKGTYESSDRWISAACGDEGDGDEQDSAEDEASDPADAAAHP